MNFKPTSFRIVIKLNNNFNDTVKINETTELKIATEYEPKQHIKIDAEVVGIPDTHKSNILYADYKGSPVPRTAGSAKLASLYHHVPKFFFADDTEFDVKVGDKAYFHFNGIDWISAFNMTNRDSHLYTDEHGYEYHQIDIDCVFGRVRNGKLKLVLGNVLVNQLESDTTDIDYMGGKFKGTIENNVITSIGAKPKYLEGIVKMIGDGFGPDTRNTVQKGDRILYLPMSEFKNNIEGEDVYVMKLWYIIGKHDGKDYRPVGNYVKMKEIVDDKILISKDTRIRQKTCVVVDKGELCIGDYEIGNTVTINSKSTYFVNYNNSTIFTRETDIYFVEND